MVELDQLCARTVNLASAGSAVSLYRAQAMTGMSARSILLAYDRGHILSAGGEETRRFEATSLVSYAHRHLGHEPLHLFDLLRALSHTAPEAHPLEAEEIHLSLLRRTSAPPEESEPWRRWFRNDLSSAHALLAAESSPPERTVLFTPKRAAPPGSYISYQLAVLGHREAAARRVSVVSPCPHLERAGPIPELDVHDDGVDVHVNSSIGARLRTVRINDTRLATAVLEVIDRLCSRRPARPRAGAVRRSARSS